MQNLSPPKPLLLTGNLAENFKQFEQVFKIFIEAAGISAKPARQQAHVLHVISKEALRICNSFVWENPDGALKVEEILKKFKDHCTPQTNITYKRHKFT